MISHGPAWLNEAIFYEIYPQSFLDTNGDGIGDIDGIIAKLDYVKYLGCNAIWINPWYVSPFRDAGYDVSDCYNVAPRYGSNGDAKRLFDEARQRGVRIILDLVPGHTSVEHTWFVESSKAEPNKFSNWYVWTDAFNSAVDFPCVRGYSDRDGAFMTNFFYMQPALNYGFANPDPSQPWQLPTDHPDVLALREEIKNIMRFWLDMGASGFRVDMASSLVKGDHDFKATSVFWREMRAMLDVEYPEAVLISEWSDPEIAIPAGFHSDFLLFEHPAYHTLFRREETSIPYRETPNMHSYFKREGKGDIYGFLDEYVNMLARTKDQGYISIVSGNHDLVRLAEGRDQDELAVAFAFILTMPGVPFIYYGDEIGMDYMRGLVSKEGGYYRTGSRTPMQWSGEDNAGFSSSGDVYLPINSGDGVPNVESQLGYHVSLLETVKSLNCLRSVHRALQGDGEFSVLYAEHDKYPFLYMRSNGDNRIIIAVNPSDDNVTVEISSISDVKAVQPLLAKNAELRLSGDKMLLAMDGVSFGIFEIGGS